MAIWMTCCCYLFHLLHQTFHLLVRRSGIKFHIDWFRIVNCVFFIVINIFPGAAPAALTFLSVALSLQKVGHPCPKQSAVLSKNNRLSARFTSKLLFRFFIRKWRNLHVWSFICLFSLFDIRLSSAAWISNMDSWFIRPFESGNCVSH